MTQNMPRAGLETPLAAFSFSLKTLGSLSRNSPLEMKKATTKKCPPLTPCEHEIMFWMAKGKTNWEMAKLLKRAEETVKSHVRNIFRKMDVHNRPAAVAYYYEHRLDKKMPAELRKRLLDQA